MRDGSLVEFASAVDAVSCAIEIQRQIQKCDARSSKADLILFRIAKRFLSVRPDFTIISWLKTQSIRDAVQLEADVEALRSAGLPMS
jgi:hypothetical protein